jgi:hypothetical protein
MKSKVFLIFSLLGIFEFSNNLKAENPKSIIGKWQVVSFTYKQAAHPEKDYLASRGDFEGMVKAKSTYEFKSDGFAIQTIGQWTQEYVYEIENGNIKMYPCENANARETCVKMSKQKKDFNDYKITVDPTSISFGQKNDTYILQINLAKIK